MNTSDSELRYQLAKELICTIEDTQATNVAITGSVSKGCASVNSDIEVNWWVCNFPFCWRDKHQWLKNELSWLLKIPEVSDLYIDSTPILDGSIWASFLYKGIWFEMGFQSITHQSSIIDLAFAGETSSHDFLVSIEAISTCLILKSSGVLEQWKKRLLVYPPLLKLRLIQDVQDECAFSPHLEACMSGSDSAQDLEHLVSNMHAFFRLLFALNEKWEPNWKRVVAQMERLPLMPADIPISDFNLDPHSNIDYFRRLVYNALQRTLAIIPTELRNHSIERALGGVVSVSTSYGQDKLV